MTIWMTRKRPEPKRASHAVRTSGRGSGGGGEWVRWGRSCGDACVCGGAGSVGGMGEEPW
eukprot:350628-Chlamydomonas_euryale.AAC.3